MPVVDAFIQLAADGAGKMVDNSSLSVGGFTVHRQRTNIAGPDVAAAIAQVRNSAPGASDWGLVVWPIGTLKVDGSAITQPVSVVGTVPVSGAFNVTGKYRATPPTLGDLATQELLLDSLGKLQVAGSFSATITGTATASAALGYTDGTSGHAINMNLAGALRVDGSAVTQPVSVSNSITPINLEIASASGASQQIDAARAARQGFWGYCSADLWMHIAGGTAAAGGAGCIKFPAGTPIIPPAGMCPVGQLNIITTAAARVVFWVW